METCWRQRQSIGKVDADRLREFFSLPGQRKYEKKDGYELTSNLTNNPSRHDQVIIPKIQIGSLRTVRDVGQTQKDWLWTS